MESHHPAIIQSTDIMTDPFNSQCQAYMTYPKLTAACTFISLYNSNHAENQTLKRTALLLYCCIKSQHLNQNIISKIYHSWQNLFHRKRLYNLQTITLDKLSKVICLMPQKLRQQYSTSKINSFYI